jgi:hypothetical protein
MNRATASSGTPPSAIGTRRSILKSIPFLAAAVLAAIIVVPALAQMGGGGELQQKMAALKQSVAENQQRLHGYQWTETQAFTLKGEPKPSRQFVCSYGPDGKVHRNLISPPPEPPSGGRMKQKDNEKKKEEMQDYMEGVRMLLSLYVPPDPLSLQQAFDKGNVSLSLFPGEQDKSFVFKNYAQPGDQMRITFDSVAKKIMSMTIDTYMDNPQDVVALQIQFARLPDGTNYAQQAVVNANAKHLVVTVITSNYQPM